MKFNLSWRVFGVSLVMVWLVVALTLGSKAIAQGWDNANWVVILFVASISVFGAYRWSQVQAVIAAGHTIQTVSELRALLIGPKVAATIWFAITMLLVIGFAILLAFCGA